MHDATLVATALALGLTRLLTFSGYKFQRFGNLIKVVAPPLAFPGGRLTDTAALGHSRTNAAFQRRLTEDMRSWRFCNSPTCPRRSARSRR